MKSNEQIFKESSSYVKAKETLLLGNQCFGYSRGELKLHMPFASEEGKMQEWYAKTVKVFSAFDIDCCVLYVRAMMMIVADANECTAENFDDDKAIKCLNVILMDKRGDTFNKMMSYKLINPETDDEGIEHMPWQEMSEHVFDMSLFEHVIMPAEEKMKIQGLIRQYAPHIIVSGVPNAALN
jgi:hypothetical protein